MIAALDFEFFHRRADLGHHAGLILGIENAVGRDDALDGIALHLGYLNRRDCFCFGLFGFGTRGQRGQCDQGEERPHIWQVQKFPVKD